MEQPRLGPWPKQTKNRGITCQMGNKVVKRGESWKWPVNSRRGEWEGWGGDEYSWSRGPFKRRSRSILRAKPQLRRAIDVQENWKFKKKVRADAKASQTGRLMHGGGEEEDRWRRSTCDKTKRRASNPEDKEGAGEEGWERWDGNESNKTKNAIQESGRL